MSQRRGQPNDESINEINLAVISKFIDGVKSDDFSTMLPSHYQPLSTNALTREEKRLNSK